MRDSNTPNTFRIICSAAASSWILRTITAISGIVVLPIIVSRLGKMEFGIWILVGQAISFFALSDFGVASAVGRFLARLRGLNDHNAINRLLSTVFVITFVEGLIVAFLTLIAAPWIPWLLGVPIEYATLARIIFIIAGLSLACQFPLRTGVGILTGFQIYGFHAIGKILAPLFYMIGVIILANIYTLNLISLSLLSAVTTLAAQGILLVVAWRMTRPWQLSFRNVSWQMGRDLFGLGLSLIVITVSQLVYSKGMVIMVGRILGISAVGIYGVALTLIDNIAPIFSSLSTPFTTLASEWQARDEMVKLRRVNNTVIKVTFALTLSAAMGLFIYAKPLLYLLLNKGGWSTVDFLNAAGALTIMGFGLALGLPQIISRSTLQGIGRHWQVSSLAAVASVFSFCVSIIAMRLGFGISGAAFGWSVYWVIQGILFYPPILCHYLKQSLKEMFITAYLPGAIVGFSILILGWILSLWLIPNNLASLMIGIGTCAVFGSLATLLISGKSRAVWSILLRRGY